MVLPEILKKFSGKLKRINENDLRRLIVRMLIERVLKEQFVSQKISGMGGNSSVQVYLILGKKHNNVLIGKKRVYVSQGTKP